jgi:hypothetical protein
MALSGWSTTKYVSKASAVVTAAPVAFAAWFYPTSFPSTSCMIVIRDSAFNNDFGLYVNTSAQPQIETGQGGSYDELHTTTAGSANTWMHVFGVWASTTSRSVYLNGGGKNVNTGTYVPSVSGGLTSIGCYGGGSGGVANGTVAFPTIWAGTGLVFSDADVAELAAGLPPWKKFPQYLIACLPLIGAASTEPDLVNAAGWTANSGPLTVAANPPIFFP